MQGNEDFFGTNGTPDLKLIVINDTQIDVLSLAKILGLNISSDRKWSHHIVEVDQKAREPALLKRGSRVKGEGEG